MTHAVSSLLILVLCVGIASAEVVGRDVEYKQGDIVLQGYLAYDDSLKETRPGVLVVHQWKGLGDYEKERARMLAGMGYVAFAVDIYGKGIRPSTPQEAGQQAGKYKSDRALYRARLAAGLDHLKSDPRVDKSRTAAIGYCFGGTGVLELARSGADIAGVVSFHGGLDNPNPADAKNIRCAVLVLHGANDPHSPADEVAAFSKEMQTTSVEWDIHLYGGAVHSFTEKAAGNDPSKGAAYDARADEESWAAMQKFFHRIFKESNGVPGGNGAEGAMRAMKSGVSTSGLSVPASADKTHPLDVGDSVPDVSVQALDGKTVSLLDQVKARPTVLIFYRGGWCPYCNAHLAKLKSVEPALKELGYRIVAISPDRPEELKATAEKQSLDYELMSDGPMAASKAFGLAFQVDDATLGKYKGYGIDLEARSGQAHHLLPVPAAYVVDRSGKILYAYANPDYTKRVDPDALVAAAKKAVAK